MSTPPLLDLPQSSCAASVVMTLTRVVGITESPFTLGEQGFRWPGERWSMSFTLPPFTSRAVASDWISFGAKLKGRYGMFFMGDPSAKNPRGIASGTPVVDGHNQSGNTLKTNGWTPNVQGILLKGDYIQIGTGISARLHLVVENVDSNASGESDLVIEPALRRSPASGESITVQNAKGIFRLTSNQLSWSVSPGPVYRLNFEAVEVL